MKDLMSIENMFELVQLAARRVHIAEKWYDPAYDGLINQCLCEEINWKEGNDEI